MNNACIIPWIHINVETDGNVYPCCAYEGKPMGNLNQNNIEQIWTSTDYINLRHEMLNNLIPEGCRGCYQVEKLGGQSKRQRENQLREHLMHLVTDGTPSFNLKYIDLRFSNICNFKCRYCNPVASHSISAEYKQLKWFKQYDTDVLKFNKENIIEHLYKNINELEEIYFCGGEPLLMDEHYEFLEKLIESKNTNLILRYSTNLSKLKYKNKNILEYWKHFSNVKVYVSLDHYGSKLEYIRNGAIWEEILENIKILSRRNNIELKIAGTVSIFNILDLPEIFETFKNLNIIESKNIGLANLVKEPRYYNVQSLNPLIKKEAESRLLSYFPEDEMTKMMCKYIVNYMNQADTWEESREEFVKITNILDNKRKENFLETFPELRNQIEW